MSSEQWRAFQGMLKLIDEQMSYVRFKLFIQFDSREELKRACSELIEKDVQFKIGSDNKLTIIRGEA